MNNVRDYNQDKQVIKSFLQEYYESNDDGKYFPYKDQLIKLYEKEDYVIRIKLDNVYKFDQELASSIESKCTNYQKLFYEVIDEIIFQSGSIKVKDQFDAFLNNRLQIERRLRAGRSLMGACAALTIEQIRKRFPMELLRRYEIYFIGRSTANLAAIHELQWPHVGRISRLLAVVSGKTQLKPQLRVATYICGKCGLDTYQEMMVVTSLPLTKCMGVNCRRLYFGAQGTLHFQLMNSKYIMYQELKVQELPDQVPDNSQPEQLKVVCYGQNTAKVNPGDLVVISGIILPVVTSSLTTDRYFEAHTLEIIPKDKFVEATNISDISEAELNRLKDPNMYEIMARSIAPEIFVNDDIKKAILIMLAKGASVYYSGIQTRGELNICLVGDHGMVQSKLFEFVNQLCPKSHLTNGKGMDRGGLTAAILTDNLTNKIMVEAGSLVLADGCVCCIDELNKMNTTDRMLMHEVLEQQTVSLSRSGINTKLNAKVSILAAANPSQGRYNVFRSLEQNIDLPAALLSKFDLMWMINDYSYMNVMELVSRVMNASISNAAPTQFEESSQIKYLSMPELSRYLTIIQMQPDPKVSSDMINYITWVYARICREARIKYNNEVYSIPKNFSTILKLSTALARLRMKSQIEKTDVDEAIRLCESSRDSVRITDSDVGVRKTRPCLFRSLISDTVKNMIRQYNTRIICVADIFGKCQMMGFTVAQVYQVLTENENAGNWTLDAERNILIIL